MSRIETDMRVTVYSTTYCGFCRRAEEILRRKGIPFDVVDVTNDADERASLIDRANGRRTVPVIFFDDRPIGGYQELAALASSGELDRLFPRVAAESALPPGGPR